MISSDCDGPGFLDTAVVSTRGEHDHQRLQETDNAKRPTRTARRRLGKQKEQLKRGADDLALKPRSEDLQSLACMLPEKVGELHFTETDGFGWTLPSTGVPKDLTDQLTDSFGTGHDAVERWHNKLRLKGIDSETLLMLDINTIFALTPLGWLRCESPDPGIPIMSNSGWTAMTHQSPFMNLSCMSCTALVLQTISTHVRAMVVC